MRTVILSLFFFIHGVAFSQAIVEVTNPLDIARDEAVVEIPFNKIKEAFPGIDTANFYVLDTRSRQQASWQLEYKGGSQPVNLLVLVNLKPHETLKLTLQKGKSNTFPAKTYGRYVPERKDDFAWENDRIAFRMYGKALENFPGEMAYGTDVWVKRTDKLIIDEWYKLDNYHNDNGDGLDYYKVGFTLGAGDIDPYVHDSIWFSKNYRGWKVLDNGPLRTTFQLSYEAWMVAGHKVSCTKTISIDAGSQMNRVEVNYQFEDAAALPVAIGIARRDEPGAILFDEKKGVVGYWEAQHGKDGITGVANILTGSNQKMMMNKDHLLTITKAGNNSPVVYYNGAVWNKAGRITNAEQWFKYLIDYQSAIQNPLKVEVKKK